MNVQARLNLRGLVQRHYALAGVDLYLFVAGLDQLALVAQAEGLLDALSAPTSAWVDLSRPLSTGLAGQATGNAGPCMLLPLAWSRGLLQSSDRPDARRWQEHGQPVALWPWIGLEQRSESAEVDSELQRRLSNYCKQGRELVPGDGAGALDLLQLERPLRLQIVSDCWVSAPRAALDPRALIETFVATGDARDPDICETFSDQLAAMAQLLPESELEQFYEGLFWRLEVGLAEAGPKADLMTWLRLAEGVIGGLNSRHPRLRELERTCRRQAITAAMELGEPGDRGLALVRLLQMELVADQPEWMVALASCVDALVLQIGAAAGDQAPAKRRDAQYQLEQLIKAGSSHLLLLKQLVLHFDTNTCYRLPTVQPPSACLVVFKGLLLVTSSDLRDASRDTRMALVALFERLMPRLWWQAPLLNLLLRDLRRFPLELTWLERESKLLEPLLTMESRGVGPSGPVLVSGAAEAGSAAPPVLQVQLLVLQRMASQEEHRSGLAKRLAALVPGAIQRLLYGGGELPLQESASVGLTDHCLSLLRIQAQQWGVDELLPLLPAPLDVSGAFQYTLAHWRQHYATAIGGQTLPISVVMTTHAPNLDRLRLALESLALQTGRPREILVVDDGTPGALAGELRQLLIMLQHALHLPIRLLRQEQNRGQYACRNLAIAASSSEAIAIQDDDDLSHPLRLECQWNSMLLGSIAVYARHLRLDQNTASPQPDGDGLGFWGDGITTLLVRREAAVRLGGFYPVRSRGDVEFRSRLQRQFGAAALHHLEQPLYLMRAAHDTVSSDFEYGCSLRLRQWRRLIAKQLLV